MTDQHIHVDEDGTRSTHMYDACPLIAQYGEYKGRRVSVTGIMSNKKPRDSFVDTKGVEHFRYGVKR